MNQLPNFSPCAKINDTVRGAVDYNGANISIAITFDGDDESDCYEYATRAIMDLNAMDMLAKHKLSDDFLDNYNDNWRDDGDPTLSAAQFMETIKLSAINICGSSQMDWFYEDGGIFCGHSLIAQAFDGLEFNDSTMFG